MVSKKKMENLQILVASNQISPYTVPNKKLKQLLQSLGKEHEMNDMETEITDVQELVRAFGVYEHVADFLLKVAGGDFDRVWGCLQEASHAKRCEGDKTYDCLFDPDLF